MTNQLFGLKSGVHDLPFEILMLICEELDLGTLARLREASKGQ